MEEFSNHKAILSEWQAQLFNFSKRNPLLNPKGKSHILCLEDVLLNKEYSPNADMLIELVESKEATLFPTSEAHKLALHELYTAVKKQHREKGQADIKLSFISLNWHLDEQDNFAPMQSPLYFLPVRLIKQNELSIEAASDSLHINPLIYSLLQQKFRLELPTTLELSGLDIQGEFDRLESIFENTGITIQRQPSYLGLYDYAAMSIVEDYKQLLQLPALPKLLQQVVHKGLPASIIQDSGDALLDYQVVAPIDPDQALALQHVMAGGNVVISGPPGTGKSQTITNLISACLAKNQRVLLISAKRAALESVYQKMKDLALHHCCALIHHSANDKSAFMAELKSLLEEKSGKPLKSSNVKAQLATVVQQYNQALARLNQIHQLLNYTVPGAAKMPIYQLVDELLAFKGSQEEKIISAPLTLLNISLYEIHKDNLNQAYQYLVESLALGEISEHPMAKIRRETWLKHQDFSSLQEALQGEITWFEELTALLHLLGLDELILTLEDLYGFAKNFKDFLVFQSEEMLSLLQEDQLAYANFCEHLELLEKQELALKELKHFNQHWKDKPSEIEAQAYLQTFNALEQTHGKIFKSAYQRLYLKIWRRTKRYFFRASSAVSFLEKLLEQYQLEKEYHGMRKQLLEKYPGMEVNQLKKLTTTWHLSLDSTWRKKWLKLHVDPDKKQLLNKLFSFIQGDCSKGHFAEGETIKTNLNHLVKVRDTLAAVEAAQKFITPLAEHEEAFQVCLAIDQNFRKSIYQMLLQTWEDTCARYPLLRDYQKEQTSLAQEALIKAKNELLHLHALELRLQLDDAFQQQYRKAQLSTQGLSEKEKLEIRELREGLKIVEKETGKSRAFQSFREWQAGPGKHFIEQLKPVWMMSPASVSDALPLEAESFDLVIFDEASQLSLAECIPAVYRAKQCVVVGDEQQLPPSHFFQKSVQTSGVQKPVSWLSKACEIFPVIELNWHYRSSDEALIRYNNEVFYNHRLKTIPSTRFEDSVAKPVYIKTPKQAAFTYEAIRSHTLGMHFMENGRYQDGVNSEEAEYIAELAKHLLLSQKSLNLGILCLSNTQQARIEEALHSIHFFDKNYTQLLQDKYDQDENFDGIFIRNLENIQGEERDIIIVSLGYGPDETGQVQLHFGPINHEGGSKRLNVLFSRAKKHMLIVSSLRSSSIQSKNEGLLCLKNYLRFLENAPRENQGDTQKLTNLEPSLPWIAEIGKYIEQQGYKIRYDYGFSTLQFALVVEGREADENYLLGVLVDENSGQHSAAIHAFKVDILSQFGWKVFTLRAIDYLINKNYVLQEIITEIQKAAKNVQFAADPVQKNTQLDELKYDESKLLFTRLEKHDNEALFWELAGNLNDIIIRYGKVGSEGRKLIKNYNSVAEVIQEKRKLIRQKEKLGYRRV